MWFGYNSMAEISRDLKRISCTFTPQNVFQISLLRSVGASRSGTEDHLIFLRCSSNFYFFRHNTLFGLFFQEDFVNFIQNGETIVHIIFLLPKYCCGTYTFPANSFRTHLALCVLQVERLIQFFSSYCIEWLLYWWLQFHQTSSQSIAYSLHTQTLFDFLSKVFGFITKL